MNHPKDSLSYHHFDLKTTIKRLPFYGFTHEDYRTCKPLMADMNFATASLITAWAFFIFAALSVLSIFYTKIHIFFLVYIIFTILTGLIFLSFHIFQSFSGKHTLVFFYVLSSTLLAYCCVSTLFFPAQRAVLFPAMLFFISVIFIDNLIRMAIYIYAMSSIYCIAIYIVKEPHTASYDIMIAFIFSFVSILLHYITQNSKMNSLLNIRDTSILIRKYRFAQSELEIRASYDSLSGLYNRSTFIAEAEQRLLTNHPHYMALCILDLDQFKNINDTYGHQVGDEAIIVTSKIIMDALHLKFSKKANKKNLLFDSPNIAGRLGGDEFIFLLSDASNESQVYTQMTRLLALLNNHTCPGTSDCLQASIGIVSISSDDTNFDLLYQAADSALYLAKASGRNKISIYQKRD